MKLGESTPTSDLMKSWAFQAQYYLQEQLEEKVEHGQLKRHLVSVLLLIFVFFLFCFKFPFLLLNKSSH